MLPLGDSCSDRKDLLVSMGWGEPWSDQFGPRDWAG
jgi:hypothetical protein